jgi:hypothetical protein
MRTDAPTRAAVAPAQSEDPRRIVCADTGGFRWADRGPRRRYAVGASGRRHKSAACWGRSRGPARGSAAAPLSCLGLTRSMSENWSTWIIGHNDDLPQGRRSQISFCYYSVSQAVRFLAAQRDYRHGVACLSYYAPRYKHIAGLGRSARRVALEKLVEKARLSTFTGLDTSDFVFVPCGKRALPATRSGTTLSQWAHERNLPDVNVHDNDHVWFCGFPRRMEKPIFMEFLKASVFDLSQRTPRVSRGDWARIRRGLFAHGFTLNRSLCSSAGGLFRFVLWAGIPEATLLRTNPKAPLGAVSEKLVLTVLPNDNLRVQTETGRCPLTSKYGKLRPQDNQRLQRTAKRLR